MMNYCKIFQIAEFLFFSMSHLRLTDSMTVTCLKKQFGSFKRQMRMLNLTFTYIFIEMF